MRVSGNAWWRARRRAVAWARVMASVAAISLTVATMTAGDRAGVVAEFHQCTASGERGQWQAAADAFAPTGQVGMDSGEGAGSAEPVLQAGDGLVEDQDRAVRRAQMAQARKEGEVGWGESDWFENDGGQVVAVGGEEPLDVTDIVVGEVQRPGRRFGGCHSHLATKVRPVV